MNTHIPNPESGTHSSVDTYPSASTFDTSWYLVVAYHVFASSFAVIEFIEFGVVDAKEIAYKLKISENMVSILLVFFIFSLVFYILCSFFTNINW